MGVTSDPTDPRLTHGADPADGGPVNQAEVYLVLSEEDRARGFVRPVRTRYWHTTCGAITTMGRALAETYAVDINFYGSTYCVACRLHRPVGPNGEFHWVIDGVDPEAAPKVGT